MRTRLVPPPKTETLQVETANMILTQLTEKALQYLIQLWQHDGKVKLNGQKSLAGAPPRQSAR